MTKKEPVNAADASHQEEQTIILTKEEFEDLSEQLKGKRIHKIRYYYDVDGRTAEIDIFQDALAGLVLIDFEFKSLEEKNNFNPPDFCLVDVTQEEFIAGGMLCGRNYRDIEPFLTNLNYIKLC